MFFGFGFPRTLACCHSGSSPDDEWVLVQQDADYTVAVSAGAVQLWSSGLHRVCLSVDSSAQQEGSAGADSGGGRNLDAFWCSARAALAVLTDAGNLNIYHVHTSQAPAVTASGVGARRPTRDTIYLQHTVCVDTRSPPCCLTGDSKQLLLGCLDGSIHLVSWTGKVRDVLVPTYLLGEDDLPMDLGDLVSINYCEKSRLLTVVLSSGACGLLAAASPGVGLLRELEFDRWVCLEGATCARVGAAAQLLAVGDMAGGVWLYRLAPSGSPDAPYMDDPPACQPPIRLLSMEPWGYPASHTGPVSRIEWSPDGRALAVGYLYSGFVVWSPSGCRLFSSLRQGPAGGGGGDGTSKSHSLQQQPSLPPPPLDPPPSSPPPVPKDVLQDAAAGLTSAFAAAAMTRAASTPGMGFPATNVVPAGSLDSGVSVLCWGHEGYSLLLGGFGDGAGTLQELQFARSPPRHHRVAHTAPLPSGGGGGGASRGGPASEELHVLQAHDRLLLVTEGLVAPGAAADGLSSRRSRDRLSVDGVPGGPASGKGPDLSVTHVPLPQQYIAANWPVRHVALNPNGMDIAVAGRAGLALYNRAAERWRLFGDVSQERRVAAVALGWVGNVVVVCTGPEAPGPSSTGGVAKPRGATSEPHHLLLFPKHHLDFTSLMCRFPLAQAPAAMDCAGGHVLLAFEGLDIALFEVRVAGEVKVSGAPTAALHLVRDVSVLEVGRPLVDISLVCFKPQQPPTSPAAPAPAAPPTRCVLHRWGGLLSLLDLERGSEVVLGADVEAFWICDVRAGTGAGGVNGHRRGAMALSQSSTDDDDDGGGGGGAVPIAQDDAEGGPREVDMPWWAYGPGGMQLWFPAAGLPAPAAYADAWAAHTTLLQGAAPPSQELELEFDHEVYPIGISLTDAAIVGVMQRISRAGPRVAMGALPGVPSCCYPIPEAQPVLPCLLRRLLLRGALPEARSLALRHRSGPHFSRSLEWLLFTALEAEVQAGEGAQGTSVLSLAASLLRAFPGLYAECVVAVARKTDASLWPPLFEAVGAPSSVLEGLVESGALVAAANMLLVVDSMEGPSVAYTQAVRLLRVALSAGEYSLAGELLRFILFPNEDEDEEEDEEQQLEAPAAQLGSGVAGLTTTTLTAGSTLPSTAEDTQGRSPRRRPSPERPPPAQSTQPAASSWFGWLFGYGATSTTPAAPGSTASGAASPRHQLTNPVGSVSGRSEAASSARVPDDHPGVGKPNSATDGGKAAHIAPLASAARRAVAEHAWALLEAGRPLQLLRLAQAVVFLPGGLAQLMRHLRRRGGLSTWQSLSTYPSLYPPGTSGGAAPGGASFRVSASAQPSAGGADPADALLLGQSGGMDSTLDALTSPSVGTWALAAASRVTAQEVAAALRQAAAALPVWRGPQGEEDARSLLGLILGLDAHAWALALSLLLGDLQPLRAFASLQPREWAAFLTTVKTDAGLASVHDAMDAVAADMEHAHSPATSVLTNTTAPTSAFVNFQQPL